MTTPTVPSDLITGIGWLEDFTIRADGQAVVSWSTASGPRLHACDRHGVLRPTNHLASIDQRLPTASGSRVAFWARMRDEDNIMALFVADGEGQVVRLPVATPLSAHSLAWRGESHVVTSVHADEGTQLLQVDVSGTRPPELLWRSGEDRGRLDLAPDVAADGRILVTVRTQLSQDLIMLDPERGEATVLVKGSRGAAPVGGRWSPDGSRIVLSVRHRRHTEARVIDLNAGTMEVLGIPEPVEVPRFDPTGTRIAFASHEWPWTRVFWYDLATQELSRAPLPPSTCADRPQWHDDACYFRAFGPDQPPSLWRWLPHGADGSPCQPVLEPPPLEDHTRPDVLRLGTPEGFDLPAIAHEPAGEARGTVIMLHGGPAGAWRVSWNPILLAMTAAGYRVVLAETRGSTFSAWPIPPVPVTAYGEIEARDVGYCIDGLVSMGLAQPGRVVLCGHSHGAFVAYRASLIRPDVAGVIMTSGYLSPEALNGTLDPEVRRFATAAYGDTPVTADPIPARCPILAVHGERDKQVPAQVATAMFARLGATGHQLLLLPEEDHAIRDRGNALRYAQAAIEFLHTVLAGSWAR